jgi:hypothetical protein
MADQHGDGEAMSLVRGGLLLGFSALIAKLFIAGEMVRYPYLAAGF